MSKLANLIKLKYELIKLSELIPITINIETKFNEIVSLQDMYSPIDSSVQPFTNSLTTKLNEISQQLMLQVRTENELINNNLINFVNNLNLQILEIYNNPLHQEQFISKSVTSDYIPKRSKIPNCLKRNLVASLRQNTSWKYPALIVNPIDKGLIDCAISSDPLYVTYDPNYDLDHKLLDQLILKFPLIYQRRLRVYKLDNYNFNDLPQNQFSVITNWNIINKFNFDELKIYLKDMFNLMRPGGILLTNLYLNTTAKNGNEWDFFKQISSNTLISIFKNLGFELTMDNIKITAIESNEYIPFKYVCWITMYKPGTLTTVKAHQALARIIPK
jgi:hypothetical protein